LIATEIPRDTVIAFRRENDLYHELLSNTRGGFPQCIIALYCIELPELQNNLHGFPSNKVGHVKDEAAVAW
jgi:hypothetical protein